MNCVLAVCLVLAVAARAARPTAEGSLVECLASGAGEVAAPGSEEWSAAVTLNNAWYSTSPTNQPAAVVLPSTSEEVAQAIKCCREHGARVTARGGSHGNGGEAAAAAASLHGLRLPHGAASALPAPPAPRRPYAGVGVMPGFVTLDLRRMDTVRVAADGSRAVLGGGARLGHVYHEIASATNGTKGFPAGAWCAALGHRWARATLCTCHMRRSHAFTLSLLPARHAPVAQHGHRRGWPHPGGRYRRAAERVRPLVQPPALRRGGGC